MDSTEPVKVDDEVKRLAVLEKRRLRQQEKYASDPEYRERMKAVARENAVKRRAMEREKRQKALESGELVPGKPGRPRRRSTDPPVVRRRAAAEA